MIEIPSVYVFGVLIGIGLIVVIVGILMLRTKCLRARRQRDTDAAQAVSNIIFNNTHNRVYPHNEYYGHPICPACNGGTDNRGHLLSRIGFPFHWWFCKCAFAHCGFKWIMVAKFVDIKDAEKELDQFVNRQRRAAPRDQSVAAGHCLTCGGSGTFQESNCHSCSGRGWVKFDTDYL